MFKDVKYYKAVNTIYNKLYNKTFIAYLIYYGGIISSGYERI